MTESTESLACLDLGSRSHCDPSLPLYPLRPLCPPNLFATLSAPLPSLSPYPLPPLPPYLLCRSQAEPRGSAGDVPAGRVSAWRQTLKGAAPSRAKWEGRRYEPKLCLLHCRCNDDPALCETSYSPLLLHLCLPDASMHDMQVSVVVWGFILRLHTLAGRNERCGDGELRWGWAHDGCLAVCVGSVGV